MGLKLRLEGSVGALPGPGGLLLALLHVRHVMSDCSGQGDCVNVTCELSARGRLA